MTPRPHTPLILVLALGSCVAPDEGQPIDPAVLAELQQIGDVLSGYLLRHPK